MANIIQFSENGGTSSSYRLYDFEGADRKGPGRFIRATTDGEAKAHALALLNDHPVELWDRARFIARYWPGLLPMAASLRCHT